MDLDAIAKRIREHGTSGQSLRPVGGGTKLGWAGRDAEGAVDVETAELDEIAEHNVGDFTAVLGAGVRIADAQARFAAEGQMLALDPPASRHASRILPDSSSARSASPSLRPS